MITPIKPQRELPAIAEPPYRTKLGRGEVSRAVQAAYRDRLIVEHLPLVRAIALRIHENLPAHVDLDDLVHAGILGLLNAVDTYGGEKNVQFASYAKRRIKDAILNSLRQLDWAPRARQRRDRQVQEVKRALKSEIVERMGVQVERWRQMMTDLQYVGVTSTPARLPEKAELPVSDYPAEPDTQPDSMCALEELRSAVRRAIGSLPERYRKMLGLYYLQDFTMREIGHILGLNEDRVSQIHKAALERMAVALKEAGIESGTVF